MEDLVLRAASDLTALLVAVLAGLLAAWLKKRLGVEGLKKLREELEAKRELAEVAVRFVEQAYKQLHGQEKFERAADPADPPECASGVYWTVAPGDTIQEIARATGTTVGRLRELNPGVNLNNLRPGMDICLPG